MEKEDFVVQAKALCKAIQRIDNHEDQALLQWTEEAIGTANDVYLVHPVVLRKCIVAISSVTDEASELMLEETSIQDMDESSLIRTTTSPSFEWRYSIVFSEVWKVPVLYFTVQDARGNPCPRDVVLSMMPRLLSQEDTWDFVSYDEHPVTGTPSYFLHPCRTREVLADLRTKHVEENSTAVLLSWICLVFPTIGQFMPSQTFQQLKHQLSLLHL